MFTIFSLSCLTETQVQTSRTVSEGGKNNVITVFQMIGSILMEINSNVFFTIIVYLNIRCIFKSIACMPFHFSKCTLS